jgi:hypothetical protein
MFIIIASLGRLTDEIGFDLIALRSLRVSGGDTVTAFVYRRNIKDIPGLTSDSRQRLAEILTSTLI